LFEQDDQIEQLQALLPPPEVMPGIPPPLGRPGPDIPPPEEVEVPTKM